MHPLGAYTDQSPDALRLTLVNGELDMSQFSLLASTTVAHGDISITATVIGASHVISYKQGLKTRHEIFACEGYREDNSWSLETLLRLPVRQEDPEANYIFQAERVPWRDPEPPELLQLISGNPEDLECIPFKVIQDFPQGDFAVTPKTVISGFLDPLSRKIEVATAHSYPNVRGLVMSRTSMTYLKEV